VRKQLTVNGSDTHVDLASGLWSALHVCANWVAQVSGYWPAQREWKNSIMTQKRTFISR
jgi:hypothetical protein